MGFDFSPDELKIMENSSNATLPKEYDQGDYSALATSMNSIAAGVMRNRIEDNTLYDTSVYDEIPFNEETVRAAIDNEKNPQIQSQLLSSNIRNWNHYMGRQAYLTEVSEREQQVASNFSTAGMIAAGLPMAFIDSDILLINPTLAGVNKVNKALNLQSRMSKVVSATVAGGLVGAESMATYELTTGIYKDDSITNSALMGMVLGGSLGMFTSRAGNIKPDYVDNTGTKVDVAILKEQELAKAQSELKNIDEAINIQAELKKTLEVSKDMNKKSIANIVKATATRLNKEVTALETKLKNFEWEEATINKEGKVVPKKMNIETKWKQAKAGYANKQKELTKLIKDEEASYNKLFNEVTKVQEELVLAKEKGEATVRIQKKLDSRIKALEEHNKTKAFRIKSIQKQLVDNGKLEQKAKQQAAEEIAEYNQLKEDIKIAKAKVKEADKFVNKEPSALTKRTEELLSPDGFKKLLSKKGLLTKRMADIQGDNLDLLGVKKQVHNYVDKLSSELEKANKEVNDLINLANNAPTAKLPDWASKLLISPISKLLHSNNPKVAGLASMLHSGTVHMGKIVARTAYRIRQELDEELRKHTLAVEYNYREAIRDGYKKSKEEFETEVSQNIYKTIGQMQRDMNKGISGEKTWKERLELAKKANVERKYFTDNKHITNSVDEMLNYYESIHARGSKLGLENFLGSNGKGYVKRFYDRNKILSLSYNGKVGREAAIDKIYDAQVAHATSNNKPMTPDTLIEYRAQATTAVDSSINRLDKMQAITRELGKATQTVTSPFKQRTIEAYDDDLMDLLEDDIFTNSSIYGLNVHGRIALKEKLGVANTEQLEKLIKDSGATVKEIDNFRVVADTILGHREIVKNPFNPSQRIIKALGSYSSLMHTAAFGVPTITEVSSIAKEFGWRSTINHLIPSIKKIKDIYLNGSPSDKNQIELFADYGSAYFSSRANRMDIESPLEATSRLQEKVDGYVHKLSVLGGLLPITDMLRMTTITAGVDFLAKMSVKKSISNTDMMRINDMGFDADDLVKIRDTLKVDVNGRIGNMNRKSWGTLDQQLTDGLAVMMERTILHPNGITLPKFMSDVNEGAWASKILMKFMRFPVESYERLLVRGMQEFDAKQALALAGNVAMWAGILMAKDVLKDEEKQKYNKDDWETQLFKDSMLNNSATSAPIALMDKVYGGLTGENLTNSYRANLLGPAISDLNKLVELRPTFSLPFYNMSLDKATARIFNDIDILDEVAETLKDK